MNEYETRRLEKIKKNEALLAELDIKQIPAKQPRSSNGKPLPKRRKLESAPSRISARIAAAPPKASYNEDAIATPVPFARSVPKQGSKLAQGPSPAAAIESSISTKDVEEIQAGWTAWKPIASPPVRDDYNVFHFESHPVFTPNKSPEEMIREGCFGGSYYRPLRSRKLEITIRDDWKDDLPASWIEGLSVSTFLTSTDYDPNVNKFKVSCGQSIEEWEAAGWISHEHDVRGWFQWYIRFFQGRRCEDDERQVSRWKKCVGETGRWRRMLLKRYMQSGVREVFDDGADEDAPEVSPVMHQTCQQWAFEVRQEHLDAYWASGGR
ncbi:unnamed protein product [Zymoseptoria tritici ST99CH_1A5]|uniref:Vegetatible incompatibility protein HET-E-1 n=3 Tax=Zymoseptoria tritici TaxID=1047171 RepID=A0A1X7RE07_ZYMT9|nr:unnamed protein product [Zymoseptoria tritici ST99CH_3D7]SMR41978.1 unnamed protein product [Zymoseptoria tritici ST99CH_1E4]SMY19319.1 unnamed protein product [Zymoseptoria tritici ST99CH_1A5]